MGDVFRLVTFLSPNQQPGITECYEQVTYKNLTMLEIISSTVMLYDDSITQLILILCCTKGLSSQNSHSANTYKAVVIQS